MRARARRAPHAAARRACARSRRATRRAPRRERYRLALRKQRVRANIVTSHVRTPQRRSRTSCFFDFIAFACRAFGAAAMNGRAAFFFFFQIRAASHFRLLTFTRRGAAPRRAAA